MLRPTSVHLFPAAIEYNVELGYDPRPNPLCGGEGEVIDKDNVGDRDAETTRKFFCFLFASDSGKNLRVESLGNLNCG